MDMRRGNINAKLRTVHIFPDSLSRDPVIWVYLYEKSHLELSTKVKNQSEYNTELFSPPRVPGLNVGSLGH